MDMMKTDIRFDDMDAEEAYLRVRALLKDSGFELSPEAQKAIAMPTPEDYGLEKFPRSRMQGSLRLVNVRIGWDWLMSFLEPHRDINGRVYGIELETVIVELTPRKYFEAPPEVQASEAYGIRPGEDCKMKAVTFIAEGEPPLSAAVDTTPNGPPQQ